MRAIFFDEDDAAEVVARLLQDGFEATLERERFQGEDDDEDHPWAVLSDAPEFVLEVLVDEHDGWLDHDDASENGGAGGDLAGLPPLVLPPLRTGGPASEQAPEQVSEQAAEQPVAAPVELPVELPTGPRRVKRPDLLGRLTGGRARRAPRRAPGGAQASGAEPGGSGPVPAGDAD